MTKFFFVIFTFSFSTLVLNAKNSHLLIQSIGEGAEVSFDKNTREALQKANFIPQDLRIYVLPKSGIETISKGFKFRFGSNSYFITKSKGLELVDGSALVSSSNLKNQLFLEGPFTACRLSGMGSCLIQTQIDGGLKFISLTGKLKITSEHSLKSKVLVPGSVIFFKSNGSGFSDELHVNLLELINSSFLIQGFSNSRSFINSVRSTALAQSDVLISEVNALVGQSKNSESFVVIPKKSNQNLDQTYSSSLNPDSFNLDPLSDLLGRKPTRIRIEPSDDVLMESEQIKLPSVELPEIDDQINLFVPQFE
jgi:hypothetical protein